MEIANQIRNQRTRLGLSQEDLAEKIYVSRQTISNWENEKSYPDLNSLLRMSTLFGISLDDLIKGDKEKMKKIIQKEDVKKFALLSLWSFVPVILLLVSLFYMPEFLQPVRWIVRGVLWLSVVITWVMMQLFMKKHDVHTFREIDAFFQGKTLDEIEKAREEGKRPYQFWLPLIVGVLLGLLLIVFNVLP